MKTLQSTSVSQKLNSEAQLARIRLAKAQSQFESAQEQSRLAKRRRKEAKQAARRARKQAKLAKSEVREAELVLAEAEAKLAQTIRPSEQAVTKARQRKKAPLQATSKSSATKAPAAAPVQTKNARPSQPKHRLAPAKKRGPEGRLMEPSGFDAPTPALSIPGISVNTVTGGTGEETPSGKTVATTHIQPPNPSPDAGRSIQPTTN